MPPPVIPKAPAQPARIPALSGAATPAGAKILRTAHSLHLGELPPATPSKLDFDDDIIE
jgi:hypothetical protein